MESPDSRDFDLAGVRSLLAIVEHGSLTRAATATEIATSQLSRRISALERQAGGRLLHRTGRGALPTELARDLMPGMLALVAAADALRDRARHATAGPAGTVEIALVPAVARPLVGRLVERLAREYPHMRLRALEAYSGQVEEWLASGRVDIGLFNRYSRAKVRGAEPYLDATIELVTARADGPCPAEVPFRALAGLPLALPPRPNSLVATLSDLAARQGFALDLRLEAGSAGLVRDAVASAGLATLVPDHLAARDYGDARFVRARVVRPVIAQRTWLALTTRRPASVAVRTVARLLLDSRGPSRDDTA